VRGKIFFSKYENISITNLKKRNCIKALSEKKNKKKVQTKIACATSTNQ
jgi:hypothetical protein